MKTGGVKVSSSPGREKLPPPPGLARLLYGKAVGSRSRGRSASTVPRSSPMFASRSRSRGRSSSAAAAAAKEGGEPSSPKVTCIGQVRIRNKRSAKPNKPQLKKTRSKSSLMPCRCLHKSLLCGLFPVWKRPTGRGGGGRGSGGRRSLWPRWSRVRSGGSGGYQQQKPDPVKPLPQPEFITGVRVSDREEDGDDKDEDDEEAARQGEKTKVFEPLTTATPPKNALLLMRCRSAPHNRSSSLATAQITVSPLLSPDPPAAPPLEEVSGGKARDQELQLQQQQEQRTSSSGGALVHEEEEEEEQGDEAKGSESRRPLVLPRSKSEPARRAAAKLAVPEASYCFWTSHCQRRRFVPAHEERAPPTLTDVSHDLSGWKWKKSHSCSYGKKKKLPEAVLLESRHSSLRAGNGGTMGMG